MLNNKTVEIEVTRVCNRNNACGKVECRGCGATLPVAPAFNPEASMKAHDWLIIMHAISIVPDAMVSADMRKEFAQVMAKCDLRYKGALDGKVIP